MNQRAACIPAHHNDFSAQESWPHEKQPQASWYGPRRERTTSWGTAKLLQCVIVIGSSLFPMSRSRFAFTRVQKLQMLSSEDIPRVLVQSKTSLWSFFCQTLCPFYLRWSVGSNLSKTTVFRPYACASEETCASEDNVCVLFTDAFCQLLKPDCPSSSQEPARKSTHLFLHTCDLCLCFLHKTL